MKAVMCIVPSRGQAETIVQRLTASSFPAEDISILLPDRKATRDFAHEVGTKAPEGAVTGVAVGGVAGGTLGLLAGLGLLVIPGVGPLLAVGPLFAALGGAAVGATGGGVVGSLVGLGVPEVQAKLYEGKISGGNVLVSAHCESSDQQKFAQGVFKDVGATDISSVTETSVPSKARGAMADVSRTNSGDYAKGGRDSQFLNSNSGPSSLNGPDISNLRGTKDLK